MSGLCGSRPPHERLRHYEALGVTNFSLWSDNRLTHEEKKRSLQRFVEHVLPALQEQPAAAAR